MHPGHATRGAVVGRLARRYVAQVACLAALVACGSTPDWGPLAVESPQDGSSAGLEAGTLRITGDCAQLLTAEGIVVTLVWRSDRVRWDAASRSVVHTNAKGPKVRLKDGDAAVVGGGQIESGAVSGIDWVSSPRAMCDTGEWWGVDDVRPAG